MNSTETYWSKHNVTNHRNFNSREESLNYLAWRNRQYVYLEKYLLKNSELKGKILLDYGCGPGNDLVWSIEGGAKKVIGIDVSESSLKEAKKRLKLHGENFHLIHKGASQNFLIEDQSIDIITSYGVLHHIDDITETLNEFKRVLKPDGEIRVMVYNKNSIWWHLYVASILSSVKNLNYRNKVKNRIRRSFKSFKYSEPNLEEIFRTSTDGPNCPISKCYNPDEFLRIMENHSFAGEFLGSAISLHELAQLQNYEALYNENLNKDSAAFLKNLTYNDQNIPVFGQHIAGINGYFKFKISN